jgi:uncharacterized protein with HEPN domain
VKDDKLYLIHILEAIVRIEQYTAEGKDAFLRDTKTQDAVLRNLQTLSESTQRLSDAVKAARPEIDWARVGGFRNVLVHNYLGINLVRVWEIIQHGLPELKAAIEKILRDLGE